MRFRRTPIVDPPPPTLDSFATGLATIMDLVSTVREATIGYRTQLEADGFSPTIAEQMAAQFHVEMMSALFRAGRS